ncbi:hypothetical protein BJ508DRAFT_324256 [Ascobolus immersus RN42]|uniref:Uncharacterized protein n=1 Tax=Ascobolus immersus RN42 TaxID=1160509 RepID=A0A3N4IEA3_ASCIM|nr:hypothetical protein BJ508DRAFT_324256 [Ascobolus immersus RN42]
MSVSTPSSDQLCLAGEDCLRKLWTERPFGNLDYHALRRYQLQNIRFHHLGDFLTNDCHGIVVRFLALMEMHYPTLMANVKYTLLHNGSHAAVALEHLLSKSIVLLDSSARRILSFILGTESYRFSGHGGKVYSVRRLWNGWFISEDGTELRPVTEEQFVRSALEVQIPGLRPTNLPQNPVVSFRAPKVSIPHGRLSFSPGCLEIDLWRQSIFFKSYMPGSIQSKYFYLDEPGSTPASVVHDVFLYIFDVMRVAGSSAQFTARLKQLLAYILQRNYACITKRGEMERVDAPGTEVVYRSTRASTERLASLKAQYGRTRAAENASGICQKMSTAGIVLVFLDYAKLERAFRTSLDSRFGIREATNGNQPPQSFLDFVLLDLLLCRRPRDIRGPYLVGEAPPSAPFRQLHHLGYKQIQANGNILTPGPALIPSQNTRSLLEVLRSIITGPSSITFACDHLDVELVRAVRVLLGKGWKIDAFIFPETQTLSLKAAGILRTLTKDYPDTLRIIDLDSYLEHLLDDKDDFFEGKYT